MICLAAIALVLLTGFHFAPKEPRKTLPILRSAAAALISPNALAYYEDRHWPLTTSTELSKSNKLVEWSFLDGMPDTWRVIHGSSIRVNGKKGSVFLTTAKNFERQLRSPSVSLAPGSYQIVVEGRIVKGGLGLGAEQGTTCLGNSFFSADEWLHGGSAPLMVRPLTLRSNQRIHVALSNWSYPDAASRWSLRRVFIRSLSIGEKRANRYAALASPLVNMKKFLVVNTRLSWNLRSSTKGWFLAEDVQAKQARAGLLVRTGRNTYGYELTAKVALGRGPYLLRLHGDIIDGGISLGALDVRANKWLGQSFYWYGQNPSRGVLGVPFSVKHPGTVELVLANWSLLEPAASRWRLDRIELVQLF